MGSVGAGPAGLTLARLLEVAGIESVVLEDRSREYVERRIRAGVLEQGTVELLREAGVGERMDREGIVHHGINLQFDGERHYVPLSELSGGRSIVIYGQTEVVKDLVAARLDSGLPLLFEVEDVRVHELDSERPRIAFTREGAANELECDVVAGCDGFHGVCRPSIPAGVLNTFDREYPFAWLGILAEVAPSIDELVYAHHERGFALLRAVPSRRAARRVAGRADLAGAAGADGAGGLDAARRAGAGEGHHRHAQLRSRADAVRPTLPRGRRGPYRPGDGRERPESCDRGRPRARRGDRRLVCDRQRHGARVVLVDVPAPRLAGRALLVVDDVDAAQ